MSDGQSAGRARLAAVLDPERMAQVRAYVEAAHSRDLRRVRVRDLRRYVDDFGHLDYLGDHALSVWAASVIERSGFASGRRARVIVRGFFVFTGEAQPNQPTQWSDALRRHRPAKPEPKPEKPYAW